MAEKREELDQLSEEEEEPVSPTGQYFNSSALSVSIMAVFELEDPIVDLPTFEALESQFLPISPRFSSIMVKDEHGIQRWKKVKVKVEDHVSFPVFPPDLPSYDDYLQDYLSEVALRELPPSRPLWDLHIIRYPTSSSGAAGTVVFKLHHSLGDGFSLMGALFSTLRRADDPSLPLTFPSSSSNAPAAGGRRLRQYSRVSRALDVCVNTIRDFSWSLWKSNLAEDDVTPVRSGVDGKEFRPIRMSSVAFSLEEIRKIRDKLGGTINDVICGVIFYAIRLYNQAAMKEEGSSSSSSEVTALVLLNTRMVGTNYRHVKEMANPANSKSKWGNQFGFLHVSVPKCTGNPNEEDPLKFLYQAKRILQVKKSSLAVHLNGFLLEFFRKFRGPEVSANYVYETMRSTSMTISNMVGPKEQMIMGGHLVRSFYFLPTGLPQSLSITVMSYMGKLKVSFGGEIGFIDSQLFISNLQLSFQKIFQAAVLN